jgi:AraC family transcriptional regulator
MEDLQPPSFEEIGPLLIAGLSESYTDATSAGIPAQWDRFVPHLGHIPGQMGGVAYGLLFPTELAGKWDYVCGVQVAEGCPLVADFQQFSLAKTKYAVFSHPGYLSTLRETWNYIWGKWLPESKLRITRGARVEKYAETFRPDAPGGVEIWIPLASS